MAIDFRFMEIILTIATILGGIAAVWFFWDKIIPLFRRQNPSTTKNLIDSNKHKTKFIAETVQPHPQSDRLAKLEGLMPDLLAEMKTDLAEHPLCREFVLLKKAWSYSGDHLVYYYDDYPELENKVRVLENYGFVRDIKYNNVARYIITEELAEYLLRK